MTPEELDFSLEDMDNNHFAIKANGLFPITYGAISNVGKNQNNKDLVLTLNKVWAI